MIKLFGYLFLGIALVATICCFTFTLFFGISAVAAISHTAITEFIVLFSLCSVLMLLGSGCVTLVEKVYFIVSAEA